MTLDHEAHRRLGVELFNRTWALMKKGVRTSAEDDEMIHCAHASAYHWMQAGTAANRARSEWQCSRMYTVLGRAEPALQHAQRCLEICEADPGALEDWDLPFAYEALARAYALAGDTAEMTRCLEICEAEPGALEDWDLPFAYEALARAYAIAGDTAEMTRCLEQARSLGAAIVDEEDRAPLEADLATIRT